MSDPIALLMQEHRLIEKVLDAFDGFAAALPGLSDPAPDLKDLVEFAREFADGKHHAKEENVLFAAMIAAGFPGDSGPIAVMLHEHGIFRELMGTLNGLAEDGGPWSEEQHGAAVRAISEYTDTLRMHIQKEDQILYPMAQRLLSPESMDEVWSHCAGIDGGYEDSGETKRLLGIAERAIGTYAAHGA